MNEEISFGGMDEEEIENQVRDAMRPDGMILGPMNYTPLKLPQERLERMKASYGTVCLQDFSDDYHLTDEQRATNNAFASQFQKMRRCKSKYRKIDEYVKAWRTTIETIQCVAAKNEMMDPEVFVHKVLHGKICVYGIKYPKYTGPDRKQIDWSVIAEYISDPEKDVNELTAKAEVSSYEVLDPDDLRTADEVLFGGRLAEELQEARDLYEKLETSVYDEDTIHEGEKAGIYVSETSKKDFKEFVKYSGFIEGVKSYKRNSAGSSALKAFAFEYSEDDFEAIKQMDYARGYDPDKIPVFKGSMLKDSDIAAYEAELAEWEDKHVKVEAYGRYRTMEEVREIEIKQMLEDNGYDLHKFYSYDADRRKLERLDKKEKKKAKRLKAKLLELTQRKENRKNGINTKKKKHKSKSKDKTGFKKQVIKATKDILTPPDFDSFDAYTKQMEGWDD